MGQVINPATGKPFVETRPSGEVVALRKQIMSLLSNRITGKYDAAQDTSQSELHWTMADELSPHSANSLAVRKKLRSRSRYEEANNGYLKGILLSLANDFVGSGPTLHITDDRFDDQQRRRIEKKWQQRSKRIGLRRKLWRLRKAKCMDGEGFALAFMDADDFGNVYLNQRVLECDYVSHYNNTFNVSPQRNEIDGIRFSERTGKPESYHVLNRHPGETTLWSMNPMEGNWYPASQVIHWFRPDRGWLRGIPETTATLPLWALLRRYTLAVVQNAEIAADFTALLQSKMTPNPTGFSLSGSPGEPTQADAEDWFSSFPVDRGMMTVLPDSYELKQLSPEQPVTIYDAFVNALVQEASRPLMVPSNLAKGNSGDYNMASSNMDRQMYQMAIDQERFDCDDEVLDPDLQKWWFEAVRVPDFFEDDVVGSPVAIRNVIREFPLLRSEPPEHEYRWDQVPEHTDPFKVAQAINELHAGGHISDEDVQAKRFNRRAEDHYANLKKQIAWREENGLPLVAGQVMMPENDSETSEFD